jgi:multidrug efflux system outer membrane protein
MFKRSPGMLAAALVLGGCTMIPKYLRPAAPVAGTFPGGAKTSGHAAEIRWRDFFTDPRLKRYIELALANNRDLRVAALNVDHARAEYRIQRSALFPTIDATGNYTRSRTPSFIPATTTGATSAGGSSTSALAAAATPISSSAYTSNLFTASVGTTAWEVDFFGRVRSLNRQALETYFATDETRRSTQLSLVAQVATQYLTLREQEEQLALARQTLLDVQKSYDLNKRAFDVGAASELDLSTSDGQVQTARINVITYERTTAQAANYLALIVGQTLPEDLPPGRALRSQGVLADIPSGLPSDLIARRPDILSAEHTLLAANADIGAARAAFFPTISLTSSAGGASLQLSQLFTKGAEMWSFSPQITIPIFTGGKNLADLDAAKISKRIEIANYEKSIQTAFREVADALAGRVTYNREVSAQEALVAAQQRRYDLTNTRYRSGADSYLAVLLAQQDLYSAQRDLVSARTDRLANLITLYKSLGGGWQ